LRKKGKTDIVILIFFLVCAVLVTVIFLSGPNGIFGLTIYDFVNEESENQSSENLNLQQNLSGINETNETITSEISENIANLTEFSLNESNISQFNETSQNLTVFNQTNISEINLTEISIENLTNLSSVNFNLTENNFSNASLDLNQSNLTQITDFNFSSISTSNGTNFTIIEEKPLHKVVIRQDVRWVKKIIPNETNVTVDIPVNASNITVKKILDGIETEVKLENVEVEELNLITGSAVLEFREGFFTNIFSGAVTTGLTIYSFVNEEAFNKTEEFPEEITKEITEDILKEEEVPITMK